jgi:hypothetical protein
MAHVVKKQEKEKVWVRLCTAIAINRAPACRRILTRRYIRTPAAGLCGVELEKQEVQF